MRPKLIKISLIISVILITGFLYWYFNHQSLKVTPNQTQDREKLEHIEEKAPKSIQLEKPPFIKD